jgi:hypothetical protein
VVCGVEDVAGEEVLVFGCDACVCLEREEVAAELRETVDSFMEIPSNVK